MSKRFRLSDESVNSYNLKVNTKGIDTSRIKNSLIPVLLNHDANQPVGTWTKIFKRNGELIGDMEFNDDLKDTDQAKALVEGPGNVGVSVGLSNVEFNEDFTVIEKSVLYEASITPIPSNGNAMILYKDKDKKKMFTHADIANLQAEAKVKLETEKQGKILEDLNKKFMTELTTKLGLDEKATVSDVVLFVESLKQKAEALEEDKLELTAELNELVAEKKLQLIDKGIADGKFTIEQKDHYLELASKDFDLAKKIIDGLKEFKTEEVLATKVVESKSNIHNLSYDELRKTDEGLKYLHTLTAEQTHELKNKK